MKRIHTILVLGTALLITACGGGGGGGGDDGGTPGGGGMSDDGTAVPASAYASVDAFITFIGSLGASEKDEPRSTGTQAVPAADEAEPTPLS